MRVAYRRKGRGGSARQRRPWAILVAFLGRRRIEFIVKVRVSNVKLVWIDADDRSC